MLRWRVSPRARATSRLHLQMSVHSPMSVDRFPEGRERFWETYMESWESSVREEEERAWGGVGGGW